MTWPETDPDEPDPLSAAELLEREGWSADAFEDLDPDDAIWARELVERESPTDEPYERPHIKRTAAVVAVALAGAVVLGIAAFGPLRTTGGDDVPHIDANPATSTTVTTPPSSSDTTTVAPPPEWSPTSAAPTTSAATTTSALSTATFAPAEPATHKAEPIRHKAPARSHHARTHAAWTPPRFHRPTSQNPVVFPPPPRPVWTPPATVGQSYHGNGKAYGRHRRPGPQEFGAH